MEYEIRRSLVVYATNISKKIGLSQTELGLRIDKDRQWMNYLEKGNGNPTTKTLYNIASELKVSVKDLFDFQ